MASGLSVIGALALFALVPKPEKDPEVPVVIAPDPPPPEEVQLEFEVEPAHAIVRIDGKDVSGALVVPRSSTALAVEVLADGFVTYQRTVVPDRSRSMAVKLEPMPPAPRRPKPTRAKANKRLLLKGDDL